MPGKTISGRADYAMRVRMLVKGSALFCKGC